MAESTHLVSLYNGNTIEDSNPSHFAKNRFFSERLLTKNLFQQPYEVLKNLFFNFN